LRWRPAYLRSRRTVAVYWSSAVVLRQAARQAHPAVTDQIIVSLAMVSELDAEHVQIECGDCAAELRNKDWHVKPYKVPPERSAQQGTYDTYCDRSDSWHLRHKRVRAHPKKTTDRPTPKPVTTARPISSGFMVYPLIGMTIC